MSVRSHGLGGIERVRNGHRAWIYLHGRRHRSPVCEKQALAQRWLDNMRAHKIDVSSHAREPVGTAPEVTFADVALQCLESLRARKVYTDRTMRGKRSLFAILVRRWGPRRVASIRQRDVDDWHLELVKAERSTSTIRHLMDTLAQVVRYCEEQGYTGPSRVRVDRPKLVQRTVREGVPEEQLARLLAAAEQDPDRRAPVVVLLAARAGLRVAEMSQLRWQDVHFARGYLRAEVRGERTDRTKSGYARTIPLAPDLRRALESLPRFAGSTVLGVSSRDGLASILRRAWRTAGLEGAPSPHRLRHAYGTREALAGVPLPVLQRRMGHAKVETTMRYVHVDEEDGATARIAHDVPRATAHRTKKTAKRR